MPPTTILTGTFAFLLLSLVLLLYLVYENGYYFRIVITALATLLFVLVIQEVTYVFGKGDLGDYLRYIERFVDAASDGSLMSFIDIHVAFYTFLYPGWLYLAFEQIWVLRLANVVVALLIIIPLNSIHRSLFGSRLKIWQAVIVLFWPTHIRWSVMIGRDLPAAFLVLVSLAVLLKWVDNPSMRSTLSLLVAVGIVFMMRIHQAGYPIFALGVLYVVGKTRSKFSFRTLGLYSILGVILAIGFFMVHQHIAPAYHQFGSLEAIMEIAKAREEGDTVYLEGIYAESYIDLLWYLPLHTFYFLFTPMPWHATHSVQALGASIEAMTVFALTVSSLWWKRSFVIRNWKLLAILGAIVLTAVGFGAVTKNGGGALRWRMPTTMLLLVITTTLLTHTPEELRDSSSLE